MNNRHLYVVPSSWDRAQTLEGDGACTRLELLAELDELRAELLALEAERGALDQAAAAYENHQVNFAMFDDIDLGVGAGLRACEADRLEAEAHAEIDEAAWYEAVQFVGRVRRTPRDFIDARDEREYQAPSLRERGQVPPELRQIVSAGVSSSGVFDDDCASESTPQLAEEGHEVSKGSA